ncbi:unnamed protein product, partial [Hapterophycus canaliculatus]
GATHGANRAVLDWSMGVIVKLAAALPKPSRAGPDGAKGSAGAGAGERHARNAERWLTDPRIWRAFVRSLRGGTAKASEPSTHLPQSASLGVLRAAIFAARAGAARAAGAAGGAGRSFGGGNGGGRGGAEDAAAAAGAGAAAGQWAFLAIVSLCGGVVVAAGGGGGGRRGGYSSGSMTEIDDGVLDELLPPQRAGERTGTSVAPRKFGGGGALMKMSLDAYVTFLEEVICGHLVEDHVLPTELGQEFGGVGVGGTARGGALPSLAEGALTELLRFQVLLQGQQTSPRKVFATFCSKLMGPLFQILPHDAGAAAAAAAAAPSQSPLQAAAKSLVRDAVFHEEHLEGFREAPSTAATLAAGSPAGEVGPSRLGAMAGAPLLLEGFIVRLGQVQQQQQQQHGAADIHEVAGTSAAPLAGGKRSRSSGGGGGGGGGSSSPASQMFRLWAVLTSTLSGSLESPPSSSAAPVLPSQLPPHSPPHPSPSPPSWAVVLRSYLLSTNSMLRLLAKHDVYRINEDWGGLEFDKLRSFSAILIRLAESDVAAAAHGGGDGGAIANGGLKSTPASLSTGGGKRGTGAANPSDATAAAVDSLGSREGKEAEADAGTGGAEEFLTAFSSLLGLNHNILHDDLRPVLRMTFEWAAAAERGRKATGVLVASANGRPIPGGGGGGGGGVRVLRALAVGLVVSLVDTYGRLRQMDHLVRALFGAVADRPEAAASVLGKDECTAALGRAFRRLPEGQIESMWGVFAVHLREGWNRGGRDAGRSELLAREVDAELFVLFVRNLHVTSSIASAVGRLCTGLAEE